MVWKQRCKDLASQPFFFSILCYTLCFFFFPLKLPKGTSERNNKFPSRHFFMCFTVSQRRCFENTILESVHLGETIVKTNKDGNASPTQKSPTGLSLVSTEEPNKTKAPKYNMKLQNIIWKKEKNAYMHVLKFHFIFLWSSKKKETLRKKKTVSFLVNGIFLLTSYWETWIYILPGGLHSHCG